MTYYALSLLPTLGGTSGSAEDINNAGQVVGASTVAGNASSHATMWEFGSIRNLGELSPHVGSQAYGINDVGQVVGRSLDASGATTATVWNGGSIVDLFPGTANAINRSGQVVAWREDPAGQNRTVVWHNGSTTVLFQSSFLAPGINKSGQVASESGNKAVRWSNGTTTILSELPGSVSSYAYAINKAGQMVGASAVAGGATLWDYGTVLSLGALGASGAQSLANDINDAGQIVGRSQTSAGSDYRAVLWTHGDGLLDLNNYLDPGIVSQGWVLMEASAINNQGWIVGSATNANMNEYRAFLLIPHP